MRFLITSILLSLAVLAMGQDLKPDTLSSDTLKPMVKGTISANDGKVTGNINIVQADSTDGDTTRIELKNAYITIVNKVKNDDDDEDSGMSDKYQLTWWNGIDLGVNGILGADHDFQLGDASFLEPKYGQSRYISFNFAQTKIKIYKNYIGLTTGMSFQVYNYKYGGSTEFLINGDSLTTMATPQGKNITKNKLRASYFAIPLMLEFNTSENPDRAFHISAGVIGKVKIENMYKQKYEIDGNENKAGIKGDLGFNTWGLDATARIGYRRLTVFAQVGLLPLFDNDNTPDVYTFATGFFIKV
jgi:hypothetical protein